MSFKRAIVRSVGPEIQNGLTTQKLGSPDWEEAFLQHKKYCGVLSSFGLEIFSIESDKDLPDGVFVEDTAVVFEETAVITRPGALSRRGETESVKKALGKFYSQLEFIREPGTLDGGDVLQIGKNVYVGITSRTNIQGIEQLKEHLVPFGYIVQPVKFSGMLHLKSGISYPGDNTVLVVKELSNVDLFKKYKKIIVPGNESYAANSININGTVLVPEGFPDTRELLEKSGFKTMAVDVSEFRKVDGGLSCLSIRF